MRQYLENFVSRKQANIEKLLDAHRQAEEPLCKLKHISFFPDYEPNYSDILLRNVYLLRYGVAYFAEYYRLYEKLFSSVLPERGCYSLFSVGSGAHLDKVAAQFALRNCRPDVGLYYIGLDCVDWADEVESAKVIPCGELCIAALPERLQADVVAFPKSISELDVDFLGALASSVVADRFVLAVSHSRKKGETVSPEDESKVDFLLERLVNRGYRINHAGQVPLEGESVFRNLECFPFVTQSAAFSLVNELDRYCCLRDDCPEQCALLVNKNPMTATTYFYDIFYLLENNDAAPATANPYRLG